MLKHLPPLLTTTALVGAIGAILAIGAVTSWPLAGVVSIFTAATWAVILADRPRGNLPASLEWMLPATGKWGRILIIGTAIWVLLAFPLWVGWVVR